MAWEDKSPVIQKALEAFAGKKIDGKSCAICGSTKVSHDDFRDNLSRKEFEISRMCQKCQDEIFGQE